MNMNTYTLTIDVDEWPSREDLQEFLRSSNSKEEIKQYLMEEFDTIISFKLGDIDLLAGYPEAFILPLHAFVANLSTGLKQLAEKKESTVPIYLQQYATSEGSPAHLFHWRLEDAYLYFRFTWGGESEPPEHLASLGELRVDFAQMQAEIIALIKKYSHTITHILVHLKNWDGDDISSLFANF